MANQTLTPTAITRKDTGWWTVVADGKDWGIPPEDRETKVSNEPTAKLIEESIGKPIALDCWEKPDGSTRMIFGPAKQGKAGVGGVTAWRNTADGQRYEQQNMNRRTALMCAKEVGERYDVTGQAVLDLANQFWGWLQTPFQQVAPQVNAPVTGKDRAAPKETTSVQGDGGGPTAAVVPPAGEHGGVGEPSSLPGSSGELESGAYKAELHEKLRVLGRAAGYDDDEKLCGLLGVKDVDELSVIQAEKYLGMLERHVAKGKVSA